MWSRLNSRAIWAREIEVSSRARYIASWRAWETLRVPLRGEQVVSGDAADGADRPLGSRERGRRPRRRPRPVRGGGASAGGDSSARRASDGRHGFAEHGGEGGHARHRSLEAADVAEHPAGDLLQARRVADLHGALHGHAPQKRRPRTEVRAAKLGAQAPAEAVPEPLGHPCDRFRRAIAGKHDLLAGGVEGVERVDELLLGGLLALERLHVVDQQRVELAVALLEPFRPVLAEPADEVGGEPVRGRVVDGQLRPKPAQVVGYRRPTGASSPAPGGRAGTTGCRPRPGISATARAAEWASRLPAPITKRSNVWPGSSGSDSTAPAQLSAGAAWLGRPPSATKTTRSRPPPVARSAACRDARVAPFDPGAGGLGRREVEGVPLRGDRLERLDPEPKGRRREAGPEAPPGPAPRSRRGRRGGDPEPRRAIIDRRAGAAEGR